MNMIYVDFELRLYVLYKVLLCCSIVVISSRVIQIIARNVPITDDALTIKDIHQRYPSLAVIVYIAQVC